MTPEEFLSQLDLIIQASLDRFLGKMKGISQALYEETLMLIGAFELRPAGNVKASADNLVKVESIGRKLKDLLLKGSYATAITNLVKDFASISTLIDNYMSTVVSTFSRKDTLYKAVRESSVQTTLEGLMGGGLDVNFVNPVKKLLRENIAGNSQLSSLKTILKKEIVGNPRLERYVNVVASDSIEQYSRNYIQVLSDDLNVDHFLYAGTIIKDSRDFCQARVGKYFTRKQVESWSELNWSGKNPATTKATIFTYLGGYACRHKLIPVSKAVYDARS